MGQRNMCYCTNFSGHFYLWGQLQCPLNLLKLVPVKISSLKVFTKIKMQITHSKQPFVKIWSHKNRSSHGISLWKWNLNVKLSKTNIMEVSRVGSSCEVWQRGKGVLQT